MSMTYPIDTIENVTCPKCGNKITEFETYEEKDKRPENKFWECMNFWGLCNNKECEAIVDFNRNMYRCSIDLYTASIYGGEEVELLKVVNPY